MIKNWIIAIGSNNADFLYKFTGTVEEAKEKLMEIVIKDRVKSSTIPKQHREKSGDRQ